MSNTNTDKTAEQNTGARTPNHLVLWASAFVLAGMILGQAGRVGLESQALADVSEVGDLTIATMTISDGSEPVAVLSRRSERLFIYGVQNGKQVNLLAVENLNEAFSKARQLAGNTGR